MSSTTLESPGKSGSVDHDVGNLADRLLKLALAINIVAPAVIFGVMYLLRTMDVLPAESLIAAETLRILFYVLLFIAVSELATAFIVKNALFAPTKVRPTLGDTAAFAKLVTGGTITLAALGAASMMYGVVLYVLGEDLTKVALFGMIALVHFRLFRPTGDYLRELINIAEMS